VRLRGVGIVRCESLVKDASGTVVEVRCTLDADTRPGLPGADRKVKGTIHWVSARHAAWAEVRLYDRLFVKPDPLDAEEGKDFLDYVNPNALETLPRCPVEPSLTNALPEEFVQFERLGYFNIDKDSAPDRLVFNRTVGLKDSWARIEKKG